jgi:hypothetical protein
MNMDDDSRLLQIKKRGRLARSRKDVDFVEYPVQAGDHMVVEIGDGKWIDKAAAGTESLLILWPLAVTAGRSGNRQKCRNGFSIISDRGWRTLKRFAAGKKTKPGLF